MLTLSGLMAATAGIWDDAFSEALPTALSGAADDDGAVDATSAATAILSLLAAGSAGLALTRVELSVVLNEWARLDAAEAARHPVLSRWIATSLAAAAGAWIEAGATVAGLLDGSPEINGMDFLAPVDLGPMLPARGGCMGVRVLLRFQTVHGIVQAMVLYGHDFPARVTGCTPGVVFIELGRRARMADQAAAHQAMIFSGGTALAALELRNFNPRIH